ncbi:MAG: hypothetical protein ACE367_01705 [Acidimicrobiales bacterium]
MTATDLSAATDGHAERPDDEPSNRRSWWRHVPGVLLFLLAGIGFGWLVAQLWPGGDHDVVRQDLGSLVTEGDVPVDPDVLVELVAYVEAATGRTFVTPPIVVGQSDEDFAAGAAAAVEEDLDPASIERSARYHQALFGDERGTAELGEGIVTFAEGGFAGYYDPDVDRLFVPTSAGDSGELQAVIVHELVHALDDQHVDLGAMLTEAVEELEDTERERVLRTVVEGRAMSVEAAWRTENDVPPSTEIPDVIDAVPPAMVSAIALPYTVGPVFIDAMGGPEGTWELYEALPATTDELLWPAGANTAEAPAPEAEGDELFRWEFGAYEFLLALSGNTLQPDEATLVAAATATDGWADGEAVLWGDETRSCVRLSLAADSADHLAEMVDALTTWAGVDEGRQVETATDGVLATACAPYLP